MINYRYPFPLLPISGQILDGSGVNPKVKFRELKDLAGTVSVGIYDHDTQAIATGSGNGKKFFIGYSSEHTQDFLDKYIGGAKTPRGNAYWSFKGEDVLSFQYSDPSQVNNERWVWGYSGSDGCDDPLPKFECGKLYGIKVRIYGNEITKRWGKDFVKEYYSDAIDCTTDPSTCPDGGCAPEYVDPETVLKSIANKINTEYESKQINLKARVVSNQYATRTVNMHKYQIVVTDDGSNMALAAVQATVPKPFKATLINRVGLTSVYEVCSTTQPAAFQPEPNPYFTKDCDGCDQNLVGVNYFDVYTAVRTVANATDIDTEGERTALAASMATAYSGTNPKVVSANGTTFTMTFQKAQGSAAPTPIGTDTVTKTGETFTVPMPSTIAWSQTCDAFRESRNLCITLRRVECTGADRLQELKDFYTDFPGVDGANITKVAGTDCEDTYNMVQYSNNCATDGCLSYETASFDEPGAYEDSPWKVVGVDAPAYDENKKVGLEISSSFPQQFLSDCEAELDDNLDLEPVKMELTVIYQPFNKFPESTKVIPIAKRVSRIGNVRQSGYSVMVNFVKSGAYEIFGADYKSPKLRRVLESNRRKQVDRTVPYRMYYLQVRIDRGNINWDQKAEIVEIQFAVPMNRPDKMVKLESAILAPLTKFGVALTERAQK